MLAAQVEDAQFALISILMTEPDPLDASSSAFLAFLRHLLHKNRSSLRDVPPPGLSGEMSCMHSYRPDAAKPREVQETQRICTHWYN